MKTVILAAGEGSRMRPLTSNRPKVMLPLGNRPIAEHLLASCIQAGCDDFIMVTCYKGESVRQYFGDGAKWGVNIEYCSQPEPAGTADAVARLKGTVGERFLVLNGDTVYDPGDLGALLDKPGCNLGVIKVADATGLGVVETGGGQITGIYEKVAEPPTRLANAGAYLLTDDIFAAIEQLKCSVRGEYELPGALQVLVDMGVPLGWYELGRWLTFSYPWDLLEGGEALAGHMNFDRQSEVEPGVVLKGKVGIGPGTVVQAGSYIQGPVIIGANCHIGPNCHIRPFTSIGDNCRIGFCVEIKNSIIMPGCAVPHFNYVGDSVIGEGCNLGAGTKVANLRFDRQTVRIDGQDTRRRKLGVVMGDNVSTGVNSVLNTGCIIGQGSVIGPGVVASGRYDAGSHVFA